MLTGELQGVWWLSGSPDHIVPGTLSVSEDARPTLVIIGSIDPTLDLPASIATVLGRTRLALAELAVSDHRHVGVV